MAKVQIKELIGVYNADGGFRGELAYLTGRLRNTLHCELCDITHSPIRRKKEWDRFTSTLPVPFKLLHKNELDDLPEKVVHLALKSPPCVIAITDGTPVVVMTVTDLAKAGSDVTIFDGMLRNKIVARGLALPA
jgi:hypothetical protein